MILWRGGGKGLGQRNDDPGEREWKVFSSGSGGMEQWKPELKRGSWLRSHIKAPPSNAPPHCVTFKRFLANETRSLQGSRRCLKPNGFVFTSRSRWHAFARNWACFKSWRLMVSPAIHLTFPLLRHGGLWDVWQVASSSQTQRRQSSALTPTDQLELPVTVGGGQRTCKESPLAQESLQTANSLWSLRVGIELATLLQKKKNSWKK